MSAPMPCEECNGERVVLSWYGHTPEDFETINCEACRGTGVAPCDNCGEPGTNYNQATDEQECDACRQ